MLYPLWTAKPGSGCTTTAVALASQLAARRRCDVLLVDLGGDVVAACGLTEPQMGLADWLAAPDASDDSLRRIEVPLTSSVSLLPLGHATSWPAERGRLLHRLLHHDSRPVVVDVSTVGADAGTPMARLRERFADDDSSLLVTTSCYVAMRRAMSLTVRPGGVVLLRQTGRALDRRLVSQMIGAPVVCELDHDPAVARAVDAGLLARRAPRSYARQVRRLVS